MTSLEKLTLSPVEVLRYEYIVPSGLSVKQFAKKLKIRNTGLGYILKGTYKMSARFIEKLAKFTNTETCFWHRLQIDYEFKRYRERVSFRKSIAPIARKISFLEKLSLDSKEGTPGNIILRNYLQPNGYTIFRASVELTINRLTLEKLITGRYRIDHIIAGKLSTIHQTTPLFWFQLQTANDITSYLTCKRKLPRGFHDQLISYRDQLLRREMKIESNCAHPGKVLNEGIGASSKMKLVDWCNIFCVSKMVMRPILMGRAEMSVTMIIKLCQLFETTIDYWLDMQIQYYSRLALSTLVESTSKTFRQPKAKLCPGEILYKDYIDPLNWTLTDFAKHIGVKKNRLDHIRHGNTIIDFDLACRLGEALDMDPMYWINLQLADSLKHSKLLPVR